MRRRVALCLLLVASASVTIPFTLRGSVLKSFELLALHLFFFIDVLLRPPVEGIGREGPTQVICGKMMMLSLLYLPVYFIDGLPGSSWIEALGLGLTTLGAVLVLWGRRCLGTMATPILAIAQNPYLYKEGPYRFIRHSIYSGFALAFLGHQMAFMFIPGLFLWMLFIASFLRKRIQMEEEMLVQQFGSEYHEYQKDTWRMFPYIY